MRVQVPASSRSGSPMRGAVERPKGGTARRGQPREYQTTEIAPRFSGDARPPHPRHGGLLRQTESLLSGSIRHLAECLPANAVVGGEKLGPEELGEVLEARVLSAARCASQTLLPGHPRAGRSPA